MLANRITPANDGPMATKTAADPTPIQLVLRIGIAEYTRSAAATMIAEHPGDEEARNCALTSVRLNDSLLARELQRHGTWVVIKGIRYSPLPGSPPDFKCEPVADKKARKERAAQAAGAREPKVYSLRGIQVIDPDGRLV